MNTPHAHPRRPVAAGVLALLVALAAAACGGGSRPNGFEPVSVNDAARAPASPLGTPAQRDGAEATDEAEPSASAEPPAGGGPAATGRTAIATGGATTSLRLLVRIVDYSFTPANLTIAVDGTIDFMNDGADPHSVAWADGVDSGTLRTGRGAAARSRLPAGTTSSAASTHPCRDRSPCCPRPRRRRQRAAPCLWQRRRPPEHPPAPPRQRPPARAGAPRPPAPGPLRRPARS